MLVQELESRAVQWYKPFKAACTTTSVPTQSPYGSLLPFSQTGNLAHLLFLRGRMYILLALLLINSFLQGSKVRRTNYGVAMSELGGAG